MLNISEISTHGFERDMRIISKPYFAIALRYQQLNRNDITIADKTRYEITQSFSIQPENELLAYMRKSKRFKYKDSRRPLCDVPIMGDIYSITKELSEAYEEGCYNAYYNGHHQCVIWED